MIEKTRYKNVWDSLDASPEEVAELKAKSNLMTAIEKKLKTMDGTTADKAEKAGVAKSCLNDLFNGEITRLSICTLIAMAYALGLEVQVTEQAA